MAQGLQPRQARVRRLRGAWLFAGLRAKRAAEQLLAACTASDCDVLCEILCDPAYGAPVRRAVLAAIDRHWKPVLAEVVARAWRQQRVEQYASRLLGRPWTIADSSLRVLLQLHLKQDPLAATDVLGRVEVFDALQSATKDADPAIVARARQALLQLDPGSLLLELLDAGLQGAPVVREQFDRVIRQLPLPWPEDLIVPVVDALGTLAQQGHWREPGHGWDAEPYRSVCRAALDALPPSIQEATYLRANPLGDACRARKNQLDELRNRFGAAWDQAIRYLQELPETTPAQIEQGVRQSHIIRSYVPYAADSAPADLFEFFGRPEICDYSSVDGLLFTLHEHFRGSSPGNADGCVWDRLQRHETPIPHLKAVFGWLGGGGYGSIHAYIFRRRGGFIYASRGDFGD